MERQSQIAQARLSTQAQRLKKAVDESREIVYTQIQAPYYPLREGLVPTRSMGTSNQLRMNKRF